MMARRNCEIALPCPLCGKRLADLKGHKCTGDIQLEFKCPGSCGQVWVTTQYIEKILAKNIFMK
jgi:Zn-finger nucleic acid-binding protein